MDLRLATPDDADALELWGYKPSVLEHSKTFLAELSQVPIGIAIFDRFSSCWWLTFTIRDGFRGQEFGCIMVGMALTSVAGDIHCNVEPYNLAALRICQHWGFKQMSSRHWFLPEAKRRLVFYQPKYPKDRVWVWDRMIEPLAALQARARAERRAG